ncbi:MAG: putative toxin-antitoxin system toxin component, PIN family [Limisphaerales bacterium]
MKVVFDAGVVFSGAGWRGEAHRCLLAMAHRRVVAYATEETLQELSELLADRGDRAKHPPATTLSWYQDHVKRVEPVPLGKQRSRDVNDDPYPACALGAGAKIIVTRDGDLLALEKPFGIQIITPRELLVRLSRPL